MITIRANNQDFEGFSRIGLKKDIMSICDEYTIECTADQSFAFPIPRGSNIQFDIDGSIEFTGSIEKIKGQYSDNKYTISGYGRDNTKIVVKTSLDPEFSLKGPIQLENAIKKTLAFHDIEIDVVNDAGTLDPLTKKEVLTDDVGATLADFFISLAQKRQVLITKNNDGNLVIFSPGQYKYRKILRGQFDEVGGQNNILEADFDFDDSERVNKVVVHSQVNLTVDSGQTRTNADGEVVPISTNKRSSTSGEATDDAVTDGSVRHVVAEHPSDDDECERQAKWHVNNQRAKATSYTCTTHDLIADDDPWQTGYLIDVIDEVADIVSEMLITAVEYDSEKDDDGNRANEQVNLTLTVPDAFSETAGATASNKQNNKIGSNWNEDDFQ